jgi:hypothetical protein
MRPRAFNAEELRQAVLFVCLRSKAVRGSLVAHSLSTFRSRGKCLQGKSFRSAASVTREETRFTAPSRLPDFLGAQFWMVSA